MGPGGAFATGGVSGLRSKGESLNRIARLLDRRHPSIRRVFAQTGGIRPAPHHRSTRALTLAEREEISVAGSQRSLG